MKIALISEDLLFSGRIVNQAERAGHAVTVIDSAQDLENVLASPPSLTLVEAMAESLPWEDWIRALKRRGSAPVVAFGGHADLELRARALAAGADDFVPNGRVMSGLEALIATYGEGELEN